MSNQPEIIKCLNCGTTNDSTRGNCHECLLPLIRHEVCATGAVRENLYPKGRNFSARYDLMFGNESGMRRLAETFGEGFAKYGADTWKKGFPKSVLMAHALAHIMNYQAGDTSEDHLAHAAWNILAMCWMEENKPEMCNQ